MPVSSRSGLVGAASYVALAKAASELMPRAASLLQTCATGKASGTQDVLHDLIRRRLADRCRQPDANAFRLMDQAAAELISRRALARGS